MAYKKGIISPTVPIPESSTQQQSDTASSLLEGGKASKEPSEVSETTTADRPLESLVASEEAFNSTKDTVGHKPSIAPSCSMDTSNSYPALASLGTHADSKEVNFTEDTPKKLSRDYRGGRGGIRGRGGLHRGGH